MSFAIINLRNKIPKGANTVYGYLPCFCLFFCPVFHLRGNLSGKTTSQYVFLEKIDFVTVPV